MSSSSNTYNPFVAGHSDAIRTLLERRIAESEPSPVWQGRASALAAIVAPMLAWARDVKGADLSPLGVMTLLQFDTLAAIGDPKPVHALPTGWLDLSDLPAEIAAGIRRYMAELPGFDPNQPSPAGSSARQIHGYALYAIRHTLV